jgi:hypothetical protein
VLRNICSGEAGWVGAMNTATPEKRLLAKGVFEGKTGRICVPLWDFCRSFQGKIRAGIDFINHRGQSLPMTYQSVTPFPQHRRIPEQVSFDRRELGEIMSLYGRMVAAGEWRDYGISCLRDIAVFAVFQRTAESPLYRIEKRPKLKAKQQLYALRGLNGQILKRGAELKTVLRDLERKLIRAVD